VWCVWAGYTRVLDMKCILLMVFMVDFFGCGHCL